MSQSVRVHLLPQHVDGSDLRGGTAVVIDVLRASTTICTALANGASRVVPCEEITEAKKLAAELPEGDVLLGGERGGVRIPGFHFDNSPNAYSRARVAGKTIVMTTTNGTLALACCEAAERLLVGSLVNRRALVDEIVAASMWPLQLVCAGTDGLVSAEDVLCAGAIIAELARRGVAFTSSDDLAFMARDLWDGQSSSSERLLEAMRKSRGGRNLVELKLDADIVFSARVDSVDLVPEFVHESDSIVPVRSV